MFWLLRASFTLLLTAVCCALAVTVPVGRRTLFEHAVAILSTQPARELGEDLVETGRHVADRARSALEDVDDSAPEGSATGGPAVADDQAVAVRPAFGNP